MRYSGHESFTCRYTWLPKACSILAGNPLALADDEEAMVNLGVGKNMVNSIRFWIEVMGVAEPTQQQRAYSLTEFGRRIFVDEGFDPYLEKTQTLWLLHWNLSSRKDDPVFAWNYLLNRWPYPEISKSEGLVAFLRERDRLGNSHSPVTLAQHLDIFLHTYLPSMRKMAVEDSLDGPLAELGLLKKSGERKADLESPKEPVYLFSREAKPEITRGVFEYCLNHYWQTWHPEEQTLNFRDIAFAECSIGQIFKLPEEDLRSRIEIYTSSREEYPFEYHLSAIQGQITRRNLPNHDFLAAVY